MQCSAVQCSAVQCSAVQCSAVQCSAVQCSAVQCSAVQCSAVQYSAVQCSAVQCNTVHYTTRTALHCYEQSRVECSIVSTPVQSLPPPNFSACCPPAHLKKTRRDGRLQLLSGFNREVFSRTRQNIRGRPQIMSATEGGRGFGKCLHCIAL